LSGGAGPAAGILAQVAPPDLAPWVRGITVYRDTAAQPIRQTEAAGLVVPLIIGLGDPLRIGLGSPPGEDDRFTSFAAGLGRAPVFIRSLGGVHCLQIDLTPPGAFRVLRRPLGALTDRAVPLEALDDPALHTLRDRLGEATDAPHALRIATAFLVTRLRAGEALDDRVFRAYRRIVASSGQTRIAALAGQVGWSRKHLAARFGREIGLPPKTVARLARFEAAQGLARSGRATGWADVAAACGFADQAHLSADFRAFAGLAPGAWAARHRQAGEVTFPQDGGEPARPE